MQLRSQTKILASSIASILMKIAPSYINCIPYESACRVRHEYATVLAAFRMGGNYSEKNTHAVINH